MRLQWVMACVLGEAAGIAAVAVICAAIDRSLLAPGWAWILGAGIWEGACLGLAQALVLQRAGVRLLAWIGLTSLGAVVGYALSILGGAGAGAEDAASNIEPPLELLIGLGAAMGLAMGALMGAAQWFAARRQLRLWRWVMANAVGWAPAMSIIMLAATSAERGWSLAAIALSGAGAGGAAGLMVAVATAFALPTRPAGG